MYVCVPVLPTKNNLTVNDVLTTMAPFLHAFTYHQYGGGGETDSRAFSAYASDSTADGIPHALIHQLAPKTEIWLGEGGGTGCSEGDATHQQASNEAIDMYQLRHKLLETARNLRIGLTGILTDSDKLRMR